MRFARLLIIAMTVLSLPHATFAETMGGLSVIFPITAAKVSSRFGMRAHPVLHYSRHHNGLDLAAPQNSLVRSILAGEVIYSGKLGAYGNLISIKHANGSISMYGHLNNSEVAVGQLVTAGQVIGHVGSTGLATGPHLHFEWRQGGKAIDPIKVFPQISAQAQG